jgi:hypothetical protein
LRGIGIMPVDPIPTSIAGVTNDTTIGVVIKDSTGRQITKSTRLTGATAGVALQIATAAESVPPGTHLTATLTLHANAPLTVIADNGQPAVDTITDTDDGLRVVYVGSTTIYQRLNAQPRIRWASQSQVESSEDKRVNLLSSGNVPGNAVLLSAPGPTATGKPATVDVTDDGTDSITTSVDAQGAGYLVVADADQVGWSASVDGRGAALVPADQGLVAVHVPEGTHTVVLRYDLPHQTAATWASIAMVVVLIGVCAGEWWWERRRRSAVETV